ncbi:hypothetical protein AOQ72_04025 [Bradyrhizobium yuanmingense]|uniref:Uncharacterized protein n=1 Tax=Bradyrhizobium yuanmingense TaxID=108015 RepID=A0A0R3BN96_9BRAD|nr:hypothetical protein AOQ72_04025 [Bradyrhizobium yuanmingense]
MLNFAGVIDTTIRRGVRQHFASLPGTIQQVPFVVAPLQRLNFRLYRRGAKLTDARIRLV